MNVKAKVAQLLGQIKHYQEFLSQVDKLLTDTHLTCSGFRRSFKLLVDELKEKLNGLQ